MYRLFPCIPIFRWGGLIKSAEKMRIYDHVKNRFGTF